jgi:DNA adenine methylase
VKPFLKWAGGKRKLLHLIIPRILANLNEDCKFIEPFVGAGAVFLELKNRKVIINDLNKDLIETYKVIKSEPDNLIKILKIHKEKHCKDYFYQIRQMDRDKHLYNNLSNVEKAARLIYLNKTCYNGLYRVNKKGEFNSPYGYYMNPSIYDEDNIYEISNYLNESELEIKNEDFEFVLKHAKSNDFVYFDPPYDYNNKGFSKYQKDGFGEFDLNRLKNLCDKLIQNGVHVLISNNATEKVLSLFGDEKYQIIDISYQIDKLDVHRSIGSSITSRKKVKEVLIYGQRKNDSISTSE